MMSRPRRARSRRSPRPERGSATVLATILVGLLTTVALGCSALGGLLVAQRRVEAAADLAALAAAGAVQQQEEGCAAAQTVAEENGGTLRSCRLSGQVVTVEVTRAVDLLFGRELTLNSRARAGPGR
jgi:secretion/DNA translocation related TadE-like protein